MMEMLQECMGRVFDEDIGPLLGQMQLLLERGDDAPTAQMLASGISASLDAQPSQVLTSRTSAAARALASNALRVPLALPD